MLDRKKMAEMIGLIQNNNAITVEELCKELNTGTEETYQIIDALIDLKLVDEFEGFFARVDLALLN